MSERLTALPLMATFFDLKHGSCPVFFGFLSFVPRVGEVVTFDNDLLGYSYEVTSVRYRIFPTPQNSAVDVYMSRNQ